MSEQYTLKINGSGQILKADRPLAKQMAVNYAQTWCIYAKSKEELCMGLKALGREYRFVRPGNVKQYLNLWILKWELSDRPFRPAVHGTGSIPLYGLAKRLVGLTNKSWGVLINLEDEKSTKNGTVGWTHIDSTRVNAMSANSQYYDFDYIGSAVNLHIQKMKDGIKS